MSRKEKSRIDTNGGNSLGMNAFDSLGQLGGLKPQADRTDAAPASAAKADGMAAGADRVATAGLTSAGTANAVGMAAANTGAHANVAGGAKAAHVYSGRIDIRREKSGRGGKVVTVLGGESLAKLSEAERDTLLRRLKNQFGCGGRCDAAGLELQGNLVEPLTPVLSAMGWRVVRTGG